MNAPLAFPYVPDDLLFGEVERRVLRACKTIRALPDKDRRFLHGGSLMNSIWRNAVSEWDGYASDEVFIRFVPKPYDVSDCLTALEWCNVLSKNDFRLIWWRSFDNVSFSMIAARIGRSDETARRRYLDALKTVWREALAPLFGGAAPLRGKHKPGNQGR